MKVINFPKRKILREKKKNDEIVLNLFSTIENETAIFLRVKYHCDSRYENYYVLTRHGDWFPSKDTSHFIKIPRITWCIKDDWIRPKADDALSKLEYLNIRNTIDKYTFLHVNKELLYNMETEAEEMKQHFVEVDQLPFIYRLKLGNCQYMSLGDKPNKYGLVYDDEVGRYLCILDELIRPHNRIEKVLFALTPEIEVIALVKTKLDDDITYKTLSNNHLVERQNFIYRELSSEEIDDDILMRLDFEYHKEAIDLRELNKARFHN